MIDTEFKAFVEKWQAENLDEISLGVKKENRDEIWRMFHAEDAPIDYNHTVVKLTDFFIEAQEYRIKHSPHLGREYQERSLKWLPSLKGREFRLLFVAGRFCVYVPEISSYYALVLKEDVEYVTKWVAISEQERTSRYEDKLRELMGVEEAQKFIASLRRRRVI